MRLLFILALVTGILLAADVRKPLAKPAGPQKVVRVPVVMPENTPIAELKASLDTGQAADILRVQSGEDELLMLLVMDVSGDLSLVDPARNTLIDQFGKLPPGTFIGLLRAQDGLQVLLDPTGDHAATAEALRAMPVTGKSGLLDSVEMASALADSIAARSAVRVAILYISDSDVRNYREDFTNPVINSSDSRDLSRRFPEGLIREKIARLTDTLSKFQTPVVIVHLAYSSERLNQAYQSGLMQLAAATGGSATFCRSQADIPDAVNRAVESIQNMQQVWVKLPPRTPSKVNIVVEGEGRIIGQRSRFVLK